MKLIEVKSNIENKIDLMIEHRRLNNSSHHLDYVLTKVNDKYYFVDARSEIITIKDNLICPYCLQSLTVTKTYEKKNGTIVQFFVKHKSKNKLSERCIFKQSGNKGYNQSVEEYYTSRDFTYKNVISVLKNEIRNDFIIEIPESYEILKDDGVYIKFKYKSHKIVNIYPSSREEFVCRLRTDNNETLFCMLADNEVNLRNKYRDIWNKNNATIVTFSEDKGFSNSDIECKINSHSKFYTTCLYSNIQQEAYDKYIVEHEIYEGNKQSANNIDLHINNVEIFIDDNNLSDEMKSKKSGLERTLDHELNRVRVLLEVKLGLKKIVDDNLWTTSDGKCYRLVRIKATKNDVCVYRECPEIYIRYMEVFGYRVDIV